MTDESYQCQAADENHSNDGSFKILVLDQPEGLDPQVTPALPERGVWISHEAGELEVVGLWAAVRWVFLQQELLGRGLQDLGL